MGVVGTSVAVGMRVAVGGAAGVDVGATLAKLVTRGGDGLLRFRLVPSHAIERAAREVERLHPDRLGLTGGGAPELARLLGLDTSPLNEFDAWRAGARALLARQGEPPGERDLLVSLGQLDEGIRHYRRALRSDPEDEAARRALEEALKRVDGEREE